MILAVFLGVLGLNFLNNVGKTNYSINTSGTSVVKQIRSLNRYETASFTIEKVIDAGKNGNEFSDFLFGDKILLIAHGEVIAGFDLSMLKDQDAVASDGVITLNLPKPEILFSKLDNDKTRVYDRKLGLLTHGDKDLEARARLAAEKSITSAACEAGILQTASNNARSQLTVLLKSLGFTAVTINIPSSSC